MNSVLLVFRVSSFITFLFLVVSPSFAHEQKTALTDMLYNERTGNLEVAHRISLHDAEHTLRKVTDGKADLATSSESREKFAAYVAERFELRREGGEPIPLTLVGQELEGGFLWVYQETGIPQPEGVSFSIRNTILLDVVEGQSNTANVRYRSQVSTFVFKDGTGWKTYPGPKKPNRDQ